MTSPPALRLADLAGRRVAVWGLGVEGRAAVELLPRLCDPPPASITTVVDGEQPLSLLAEADVVVASPGVSRHRPEAVALRERITGGTALYLAERAGRGVIGVTGSKGKSTTTALLAHLWSALAGPAAVGGNLGLAPLRLLAEDPGAERVALEVSSFQASDVAVSPEVGVLTALAPDHLDWHGSYDAYVADKLNLFRHGCRAVAADVQVGAAVLAGLPGATPYGVEAGWHVAGGAVRRSGVAVLPASASPLPGPHNLRNLCGVLCALELAGVEVDGAAAEAALRSFRPLPFRLEPLGAVDGRDVVDDSISTNPTAAVAALASFPGRPVVLLAGGDDRRGVDLAPLATAVAARAEPTLVVCTGPAGRRLATLLPADLHHVADGFDDAVRTAADRCPEGGVLLLSPGAPSFDEFTSYRERGARLRTLLGLAAPAAEL